MHLPRPKEIALRKKFPTRGLNGMRFNKILHPEIALGKRGPKEVQAAYRSQLSDLRSGKSFAIRENINSEQKSSIEIHLRIIDLFERLSGKIYHFNSSLAKELSEIRKNIPTDQISDGCGYISFSEDILIPNTDKLKEGCFNEPIKGFYFAIAYNESFKSRIIGFSFIFENRCWSFAHTIDKDLASIVQEKEINTEFWIQLLHLVFNTLIYVHSETPVFELARPHHTLNKSKKEIQRSGGIINECTLPVTFVHRNYHGNFYNVEGCQVKGHMRWQRCGEQWSKVKLVWINPHERKYKNLLSEISYVN
jgi:hypothetical protein